MRFLISFWCGVLTVGLLWPSTLSAQKKVERDSILQAFKGGTLIVRLKSNAKKLAEMDRLLTSRKVSDNQKKNLQKRKSALITEQSLFNADLVHAMDSIYHFSTVRYMYDKDIPKLKAGELDGIFLDGALNPIDGHSDPIKGAFFFFGEGNTNTHGNSVSGLLVMDGDGRQMPNWFPNFYRAKSGSKSFLNIFSKKPKTAYRPAADMVRRLQTTLDSMWEGFLIRKKEREAKAAKEAAEAEAEMKENH